MLFNSYVFILIFLPITLMLFFTLAKYSHRLALGSLLVASVIFYGWNDYRYVLILFLSITVNYIIGKSIINSSSNIHRKNLLLMGICFNLGLLGYYKYVDFIIQNINYFIGANLSLSKITLPIGISFFTFTQIAYLVDSYRGEVKKYHPLNYALFVTYFPHLIAGPIIHHKEVMPQFDKQRIFKFNYRNIMLGLTLFSMGLFKKGLIADNLAYFVSPVFDGHAQPLGLIEAWTGALSYTFELYFDFSGYSDMALGLSLLIGIKLPINFYSPYKATNIIEFWRRWNMTLSRFLRDYLYIPLGGNRKGPYRRYINLMITMILGGLWHGASWTFVVWGFLHGLYLCINHAWSYIRQLLSIQATNSIFVKFISCSITFIAVVVAWVFFRASDIATGCTMISAMFMNLDTIDINNLNHKFVILFVFSAIITWVLPNSYQVLSRYKPALAQPHLNMTGKQLLTWKPILMWNGFMACVFVIDILCIQETSIFLYFRF